MLTELSELSGTPERIWQVVKLLVAFGPIPSLLSTSRGKVSRLYFARKIVSKVNGIE